MNWDYSLSKHNVTKSKQANILYHCILLGKIFYTFCFGLSSIKHLVLINPKIFPLRLVIPRIWRQWWKCQTWCQNDPHTFPGSRKVSSIFSKISTPNLLSSASNPLFNLFPMLPCGTHHKLLILKAKKLLTYPAPLPYLHTSPFLHHPPAWQSSTQGMLSWPIPCLE